MQGVYEQEKRIMPVTDEGGRKGRKASKLHFGSDAPEKKRRGNRTGQDGGHNAALTNSQPIQQGTLEQSLCSKEKWQALEPLTVATRNCVPQIKS